MPLKDLAEFLNDNSNSVHEMLIARILLVAIQEGDHHRLEWIYSRLFGKIKENIDLTVNGQEAIIEKWRDVDPIEHIKLLREAKKVDPVD